MNMLKWLLKLCLSAILVSFLTIMTTGFVVNAYIQSLLASFNIQLEGQPFGLSTMMQSMLGDRGPRRRRTRNRRSRTPRTAAGVMLTIRPHIRQGSRPLRGMELAGRRVSWRKRSPPRQKARARSLMKISLRTIHSRSWAVLITDLKTQGWRMSSL